MNPLVNTCATVFEYQVPSYKLPSLLKDFFAMTFAPYVSFEVEPVVGLHDSRITFRPHGGGTAETQFQISVSKGLLVKWEVYRLLQDGQDDVTPRVEELAQLLRH